MPTGNVEPAIFGTLLVRALDPVGRHKLGAHDTPARLRRAARAARHHRAAARGMGCRPSRRLHPRPPGQTQRGRRRSAEISPSALQTQRPRFPRLRHRSRGTREPVIRRFGARSHPPERLPAVAVSKSKAPYRPRTLFSLRRSGALCLVTFALFAVSECPLGFGFSGGVGTSSRFLAAGFFAIFKSSKKSAPYFR